MDWKSAPRWTEACCLANDVQTDQAWGWGADCTSFCRHSSGKVGVKEDLKGTACTVPWCTGHVRLDLHPTHGGSQKVRRGKTQCC